MTVKDEYRALCRSETTIPVFSRDWWLNAVCGPEHWDVAAARSGEQIVATLPYYLTRNWWVDIIKMPQLTQHMGVWIRYPQGQKHTSRLSLEKKVMTELIDTLPRFDCFHQNFHYSLTNWLPFYWRGFKQTTCYTYVIEDLEDLDSVFDNFDHAKRKNIKRAEKTVTVKYDLPAKEFYENHKMTLAKQGQKISYSYDLFSRIYCAAYANNSGKTIYCTDDQDNIHAGLFVIWDECSAYDLISTIDPAFRNSGAASLLIREIIKYVSSMTGKFDFEGSMIEPVERSFRSFGARQKPYFLISKDCRGTTKKLLSRMRARTARLARMIKCSEVV